MKEVKIPMRDELPNIKYPYVPDKVITYLKQVFPNKLPERYVSDYELGFLIGQQKVIEHLVFVNTEGYNKLIDDEETP